MPVSRFFEFRRTSGGRKGNNQPLVREAVSDLPDRRGQVAVARHNDGSVIVVVVGIDQQLGGDVDVGHFFLVTDPRGATGSALLIFWQIVAKVAGNLSPCGQRVQPQGLTFGALAIGLLANPGGKVVTVHELLSGLQEGSGHGRQIQPVVLSPAFGTQAKVEIEAVDIADDAVHNPCPSRGNP